LLNKKLRINLKDFLNYKKLINSVEKRQRYKPYKQPKMYGYLFFVPRERMRKNESGFSA
jgi:hypothetical protein